MPQDRHLQGQPHFHLWLYHGSLQKGAVIKWLVVYASYNSIKTKINKLLQIIR